MSKDVSRSAVELRARIERLVSSGTFQALVVGVIIANAVTLGLQTYPEIRRDAGSLLNTLDSIFLGFFCVEIGLRIAAYGRRPDRYFRRGWNIFDFVVVAAAFAPGLRENATLLRLVRLLRVVRIVSVLPDLRVLMRGMVASIAPISSMAVLAALLMYVYGIIGWLLFRNHDPEHWATVGEAVLTLFIVMTLESWPEIMGVARELHPASWLFFVSYVLIASFLLINVLIAILINAIEEARAAHRRESARALSAATDGAGPPGPTADGMAPERVRVLEERALALRTAMEDLEAELGTAGRRTTVGMASKGRLKP